MGTFYRGPLLTIISNILKRNNFHIRLKQREKEELQNRLKGVEFSVCHLTNRKYTFVELTFDPASDIRFQKDGQETDVVTYFKNQYNITLKYPSLPCVTVLNKTHIPIELCQVDVSNLLIAKDV